MVIKKIFAYVDLFYRWLIYDYDWVGDMERDTQFRVNVICATVLFGGFLRVLKWCGMELAGVRWVLAVLFPLSSLIWLSVRRRDTGSVVIWCLKNLAFWTAVMSAGFLAISFLKMPKTAV